MPTNQHELAKKLVKIIASAEAQGKELTYLDAARLLGRVPPARYCRPTAHVCNLIDAAACLAGVPLLALVKVLSQSRDVNPEAFHEMPRERRDAIIARSRSHRFCPDDYARISVAIDDLGERGDKKAWQFIEQLYPGELSYKRLMGDYEDASVDAINDIGTDVPGRTRTEGWSYARDQKVRDAVLERAEGKCEYCNKLGFVKPDGTRYLEAHHVIALANVGEDRLTNVIALCPNDHREAHFGERRKQIEREMIQKLLILSK